MSVVTVDVRGLREVKQSLARLEAEVLAIKERAGTFEAELAELKSILEGAGYCFAEGDTLAEKLRELVADLESAARAGGGPGLQR